MERLYGDSLEEYYEQLAHHYEQSGLGEKASSLLERLLGGKRHHGR